MENTELTENTQNAQAVENLEAEILQNATPTRLTAQEQCDLIDEAIDNILANLKDGIEIQSYTIGNTTITRRNPIELIDALRKLKSKIKAKMLPSALHFIAEV